MWDERAAVVAHSVLEGVLHEDDQQLGRDRHPGKQGPGIAHADVDGIDIADAHQLDSSFRETARPFRARYVRAPSRRSTWQRIIFESSITALLAHSASMSISAWMLLSVFMKKCGLIWCFQIIHLGLEVLALQRLHGLLVADRLVHELDAAVGTGHEEAQDDVPVELQIGERRLMLRIEHLDLGIWATSPAARCGGRRDRPARRPVVMNARFTATYHA